MTTNVKFTILKYTLPIKLIFKIKILIGLSLRMALDNEIIIPIFTYKYITFDETISDFTLTILHEK